MSNLQKIIELSKQIGEIAEKILTGNRTPITKLGLSGRATNALHRGGIEYVEQLIMLTKKDLLRLRNMGEKTAKEIQEKIKVFGFDYQ